MFYTTKNIISDYLIEESERAVLLFGGDSRFRKLSGGRVKKRGVGINVMPYICRLSYADRFTNNYPYIYQ